MSKTKQEAGTVKVLCCGADADAASAVTPSDAESVRDAVRDGYGRIARGERSGCCGGGGEDQLATALGYGADELAAIPEGANLGLSCGNPTVIASLKPGEVVLDLGAGGGFDVFVAGAKVGAEGRAIGVDMTADMLARARHNAESYRERTGLDNVEFRLGEIEHLPVADASIDVVVSNCVINLSPDKPRVWREIARVLRPGGRVAVSDIALLQALPGDLADRVETLVGCVAGAVLAEDTRAMAADAGLADIALDPKPTHVDSMTDLKDPVYQDMLKLLPEGTALSDFVVSLDVRAVKR